MKKTLLSLSIVLSLSACSMLNPIKEKGADEISDLIVKYCKETDLTFREDLRERILGKLPAGHSIKVECP